MKKLTGEYFSTLDEKGRISFPTKIRASLEGVSLVVTRSLDKCLWIFASDTWERIDSNIEAKYSLFSPNSRNVVRQLRAPVTEIEFDKTGRFLIPQPLREYAGLSKDCVILGLGNYMELWDAATYKKYMDDNAESLAKAAEEMGAISF